MSLEHAGGIQKQTILNGLVLSNTCEPVSGTWSILFPCHVILHHSTKMRNQLICLCFYYRRRYRDWLRFWTHLSLGGLIVFSIASFCSTQVCICNPTWANEADIYTGNTEIRVFNMSVESRFYSVPFQIYKTFWAALLHYQQLRYIFQVLRGNCTPNQNYTCFVHSLKIINAFWKYQIHKWYWNLSRPIGSWVIDQNMQNIG